MFAFLAEHRGRLFPAEMFDDLFPSARGRPSVPAEVVATVIVLQALHGLSDREAVGGGDVRSAVEGGVWAARSTRRRVRPVDVDLLAPAAGRLERPNRIFEVVAEVVAETGALTGKTRRALDSTILDDAVARQDTVTQLIAAIRRVAREVPGAGEIVTVARHRA